MIDPEVYVATLLDLSMMATPPDGFDLWIAPDIDVKTLDELPALTWNLSSDNEDPGGPGAWWFILNANVFGDGMDAAKAATSYVHGLVEAWFEDPEPTGITPEGADGPIFVAQGETSDYPTRQPSADLPGRLVVQYSGSYRLLLRS